MVTISEDRLPLDRRPSIAFTGLMAIEPGRHRYRLPERWSLLQVHYTARARLGDEDVMLTPGMVMFMEPGVPKDYQHTEAGTHHVVQFTAPRPGPDAPTLPRAFDPGLFGSAIKDRFDVVVRAFPDQRLRAEVALWDLLHLLDESRSTTSPPNVVTELTRTIDDNLHSRLVVADLVSASGYSHGHLLELFRATHGESIVGYIRRRRMEQARRLLATDMPIAAIASQIAMPDLQAFNKAIRQQYGSAPRALRRQLLSSGRAADVRGGPAPQG